MQRIIELRRRIHILPHGWVMGMILIVTAMAGPAAAQYPALSEYQDHSSSRADGVSGRHGSASLLRLCLPCKASEQVGLLQVRVHIK